MENIINYIYVITSIGFIINTSISLLTVGAVYNLFTQEFPINKKSYFTLSGLIILALIVLKIIFIFFLDKDAIITNQCATYYCDHINERLASFLLMINAFFIFIKYIFTFSISDVFDNLGGIICAIILVISGIVYLTSLHFSTPEYCKAIPNLELLNNFWSQ